MPWRTTSKHILKNFNNDRKRQKHITYQGFHVLRMEPGKGCRDRTQGISAWRFSCRNHQRVQNAPGPKLTLCPLSLVQRLKMASDWIKMSCKLLQNVLCMKWNWENDRPLPLFIRIKTTSTSIYMSTVLILKGWPIMTVLLASAASWLLKKQQSIWDWLRWSKFSLKRNSTLMKYARKSSAGMTWPWNSLSPNPLMLI